MKSCITLFAAVIAGSFPFIAFAADPAPATPILFNDNGAWCWFQSERALVDPATNTLLIASVADIDGPDGKARSGDIDLVSYHLDTAQSQRTVLHHNLQPEDDHNTPGLLIRPDGRYLAMYSHHHKDSFSYYRISKNPHDASDWSDEKIFDWSPHLAPGKDHVTYHNLFYLSAEQKLYDFSRAANLDPSILTSSDQGDSWSYAGKLLTLPRLGYVNGYVRYASNNTDRIDFLTTEHHPRDFNNSVYHGYVQAGKLHNSTGTVIDDNLFDDNGHPQTELTKVFAAGTVLNGDTLTHSWIADIRLDPANHPVAILTARANDNPDNSNFNDHRFLYARFDGTAWHVTPLAKAGARLWKSEEDYTGLGALNPADTSTLFISTTIDPRTDTPTKFHELYKGITPDNGTTWSWTPITRNSPADNLRPIVPIWPPPLDKNHTALLWFRGTMTRSQHYNTQIVGLINPAAGAHE